MEAAKGKRGGGVTSEHDDARRLYDRLNQARANNGGSLSKEEWLRICAEQFRAVRDNERIQAGRRPKRLKGERDVLFDTLATACGVNLQDLTPTAAKAIGIALADIRTATPGVTPEEIRLRVQTYQRKNPQWALTPMAIAKNWATLGTVKSSDGSELTSDETNQEPADWAPAFRRRFAHFPPDVVEKYVRDGWQYMDHQYRRAIHLQMRKEQGK